MSFSILPSIERLRGRENFDTWKFAVENYLILDGLWNSVLGTETKPEKLAQAKSKIILLIDSSLYVHIKEATTPKEVWTKLSSIFDDSGLTRRVNKIISTANKLNAINLKVEDEWVGSLLLSGLPDEFQP